VGEANFFFLAMPPKKGAKNVSEKTLGNRQSVPCRHNWRTLSERLNKQPPQVQPLGAIHNVREVTLLDSQVVYTLATMVDDQPNHWKPLFAEDANMIQSLRIALKSAMSRVCKGMCASQAAHDRDQRDHPEECRRCPK
jgi:hypothetical protein